jgi:hypothetical protein
VRLIGEFLKPPQIPLYHYTTASGLLDITSSCQIWATHVRHLNDSSEYYHALDLVNDSLEGQLRQISWEFPDYPPDVILEGVRELDVFVACFSEEENLLSQWRAYCPEGGYSIGFMPHQFQQMKLVQTSSFVKCVYEESDQLDLVNAIAKAIIVSAGVKIDHIAAR